MAGKNQPVKIRIAGDSKLLDKSLKKVGKSLGGLAKIGKTAGLGMAAGLGVGVAAVVKLGSSFEQVERTIRVGTGATGDALDEMIGISKNLATKVPSDFEEVATAVSDINTRLGLSGKDLEDFSEQMLNLSRITGDDLQGNIQGVSRVLGDWGDQAGTAAGAADFLFSVAQSTGIEFAQLSRNLVAYGAPLRQVGFTFEESAVLIGKFEKEGVNAELVLGSLRQALGKMAREGEPAIETFKRTTEAIKNAGTASEANQLALELFGARAGPDMAAAIREGRFELDDYFDLMDGGGDRINKAAKETETLGEKMTILKNRVIVALAPVVEKVFAAIERAFEKLRPHVERLTERFRAFLQSEEFERFQRTVAQALNTLRDVFDQVRAKVSEFIDENPKAVFAALAVVIGTVLVGAIVAVVAAFATLLSPIVLVVAAVAGLAAGVVYAWERFELFRDIVHGVANFFQDTAWPIFQTVIDKLKSAFDGFYAAAETVVALFKALFEGDMAAVWENFKDLVAAVIGGIVTLFIELPMAIFNAAKPLLGKFALIVANFSTELVGKIIKLVQGMPDKIVELLGEIASDMIDLGLKIGGWIVDGLISAIIGAKDLLIETLKDLLPGWLLDALGSVGGWLGVSASGGRSGGRVMTSAPWGNGSMGAASSAASSFGDFRGGIASQLDLSPGSQGWFSNPETIGWFRQKGLLEEFSRLRGAGNVAGIGEFIHGTQNGVDVTVNVHGSVVTENELVEGIREGLLESQRSGRQLVI